MFRKTSALSLLVVAGLAAGASAQIDLHRVGTHDIAVLSDASAPDFPARYIGNAPTAIAFDGVNLYVGGANTSGGMVTVQIVRINNVLGTPTYTLIPETIGQTEEAAAGYRGFDWDPASRRLLATRYRTTAEASYEGAISLLTFDESGALIDIQRSHVSNFDDGAETGPAFDYGFGGAGFDYLPFDPAVTPIGDNVADGPVPATLYPGNQAIIGMFESVDGEYNLNTLPGLAYYDFLGVFWMISQTSAFTDWRDLDVHPATGMIVARTENQLLISSRSSNNTPEAVPLAGRITPPHGAASVPLGQNCEILHDLPAGDVVIWNNRWDTASGKPFDLVHHANSLADETEVVINWFDVDGTPLTFGEGADIAHGNGLYAYSWDADSQTLAVCDSANKLVHFFSVQASADPCPCETNGVEGVDVFDLLAFLDSWFAADAAADIDGTPGVDVFDLLFFLDCWFPASAGAPC